MMNDTSSSPSSFSSSSFRLSKKQIETFHEDGILVVDQVLDQMEVQRGIDGLEQTLRIYGIDTTNLESTAGAIQKLSSTNGSGGVLDLFYPSWKLKIATHPKLFTITQQLWDECYCHDGETKEEVVVVNDNDNNNNNGWKWHPYGPFNVHQGYMYIDRIGYRLPTEMAQRLGEKQAKDDGSNTKKKKKMASIQRCLTPHLDCCPGKLFSPEATKFRPIQCFVSLTDNTEPNTGGFEAAPGFHQTFDTWAKERPPTVITKKKKKQQQQQQQRHPKKQNRDMGNTIRKQNDDTKQESEVEITSFPAPCVGDYTHIRPNEDRDVMDRIRHIPVKAGSAVFWDNRIPHGNAYNNTSAQPRAVVYCSFLPNVPINRTFVKQQLVNWQHHERPTDFWIHLNHNGNDNNGGKDGPWNNKTLNHDNTEQQQRQQQKEQQQPVQDDNTTTITESKKQYNSSLIEPSEDEPYQWTSLGRKLIGLDPW